MTEPRRRTRIALPTGVTLNVQLGGPEDGEPIVFLHGFPESHRTWRAVAPALAPRLSRRRAGPARLRRLRQAGGRRGLQDRPDRRGSDRAGRRARHRRASPWSATIGAARSPGWRRCAIPTGSTRLVIVNAPHPLVFQKSLIEDAAQRAASQYITRLPQPGDGAGDRGDGLRDLLREDLRQPCRSRR